jgi:parallel beta-helix repeat protein
MKIGQKGLSTTAIVIALLAIVVGVSLAFVLQPRTTTLAAAVEGYTSGLGISGTSYEIVRQSENEAEVIIYLEIIDNGQVQKVPIKNLLLQKDSAGNWGVAMTTPIVIPTAPTTLNLTPATIYVNTELFGSASGSTDADGNTITYYYKFYNQTDGATRQNYSTDNSYTITTADAHDNIKVFAKAYDGYEYSAEKENSVIVSNSLPAVPTGWTDLGMNLTNHTPAISWTKGTDSDGDTVTTYVYVGTTSTPTTEETHKTGSTANLGSTVTLSDGATYYYRLRSWDGYEWSDYTAVDTFRMNTPPTVPTSFTDLGINLTDHTPKITWTKGTDAEGDTVWTYVYCDSSNPPTTLENSTIGTAENLGEHSSTFIDGAIYYYRLRSWDGYEWSDYTAADQFSMHAPPGTPRSPIYIQNDTYFSLEKGVNVGGSGTADDPYIIENWAIDASDGVGIDIQNTTKYFIVRNCLVENGGSLCDGIRLYNVINGRIENNICSNNANYGINLESASNNNLINNTCSNNSWPGINLRYSSNYNTLAGNTCEGNSGNGIKLESSSNNTITNNNCSNNHGYGITLESSSNYNTLAGNTCENHHGSGYYYYGINLDSSSNNTLAGNTCEGNSTHGIYLGSSSSNNLTNNTCSNNGSVGINLYSSSNNTLTGNTCENNTSYGIWLYLSSNYNNLTNNTCENNTDIGIDLGFSSNYNTMTGNTCSNNIYSGIILESAPSNNNIDNNTCSNNGAYGIYLSGSFNNTLTNNNCSNNNTGIYLNYSPYNNLTSNTCSNNNSYGIYLVSSSYDNLTGNTCSNNNTGIYLNYSPHDILTNNIITLNYLLNNTVNNAYDDGTNSWNNNGMGNYWSDWQPPEHPDANDDGIVDEPRPIAGGGNQDNYPLVQVS